MAYRDHLDRGHRAVRYLGDLLLQRSQQLFALAAMANADRRETNDGIQREKRMTSPPQGIHITLDHGWPEPGGGSRSDRGAPQVAPPNEPKARGPFRPFEDQGYLGQPLRARIRAEERRA